MRCTVSADVAPGSWRCGYPETDIGDRLLVAACGPRAGKPIVLRSRRLKNSRSI